MTEREPAGESFVLRARHISDLIGEAVLDPARVRLNAAAILSRLRPREQGPSIADFQPVEGYAGTAMVVTGNGFAPSRLGNQMLVGGKRALVVEATETRLLVITDPKTVSGPVEITVDGETTKAARPFAAKRWPDPGFCSHGPPFSFAGKGMPGAPAAGTIPKTGTVQVLVVPCHPTDEVPTNLATERAAIQTNMQNVTTFYDQASYGQLTVDVEVANFVALFENADYYHRTNGAPGYPNIDTDVMAQLMAECANGAQNQGLDLDDYVAMVVAIHLPGREVRAWGGWESDSFAYDDSDASNPETPISITTTDPLTLVAQGTGANWGRTAHEIAHGILDGGLVLGEDVYRTDLVDSSEATATQFAMMGSHDSHPLFAGFNIHQLEWFDAANVIDLVWSRNPFSQTYDIVAHGLAENTTTGRCHLVRIKISNGLYYFIEVRQRPDAAAPTPQIFDTNIPLAAGGEDGGVVVTKSISGTVDNNHQTRLVTLLHDNETVLATGDFAEDPLRQLKITVVDDDIQTRPRVCRVRVEWAQSITADPTGTFDLHIEPWGPGWETEDIWVDRNPYGSYDFTDPTGNPTGNGDEPRPMEVNRFYARIRNDGTSDATDVKVSHYVISPPGVGDNGTWTPIDSYTVNSIPKDGSVERYVHWVPLVGEHTCLKVAISKQLGEIDVGNNSAQENVFTFQPAASIPEPVELTLAVRNPRDEELPIFLGVSGVPHGYYVYLPHRWVWLKPLAEKKVDLLIVPWLDLKDMQRTEVAEIKVVGWVPHGYSKSLRITGYPASRMLPIGGVLSRVIPKHHGAVTLDEKVDPAGDAVVIGGRVEPQIADQQLRVDMTRPDGSVAYEIAKTDQAGRFYADFRLGRDRRESAWYRFQAHIFNASRIAPCDSNVVTVEL